MPPFVPLAERFAAKVRVGRSDECWPWTASVDHRGYGQITSGPPRPGRTRTMLKAHRVAYERAYGPIPEGLDVLHHCDNPPCCNPKHLFPGTDADNIADKCRKGRQQRGVQQWNAKLTDETVLDIVRRVSCGESMAAAGRAHNLSRQAARQIIRGQTWKHLNVSDVARQLRYFPQRRKNAAPINTAPIFTASH